MRKPRDFDAELKALQDKARDLKSRKVQQLGELVIATGADSLSADELAGALIVLAETKDAGKREAWAKRGRRSFRAGRGELHRQLSATLAALGRNRAARNRQQAARARHDMRTWQVERRKRTRHLIELGGLVVKAGIVDLTGSHIIVWPVRVPAHKILVINHGPLPVQHRTDLILRLPKTSRPQPTQRGLRRHRPIDPRRRSIRPPPRHPPVLRHLLIR